MINFTQLIKKLVRGERAVTIAGYPEQNVKNGLQYYTRIVYPLLSPIGAGESKSIIFKTTSKKKDSLSLKANVECLRVGTLGLVIQ